jgi:glutaredoxin 3
MDQKEVVVYIRDRSLSCWRARRLLRREGYAVEVVDTTGNDDLRARLARLRGRTTVPYVFVDGRPVGGLAEIKTLSASGALARITRGEV